MARTFSAILFAALAVATAHAGAQATRAAIRVDEAWARRAVMLKGDFSGTGAIYATLVNAGPRPDTLIAARTDAAEVVEIHETYEDSGLSRMRQVAGIEVPPGATVMLKPGGYHIMLINLKRDLKVGQPLAVTLVFKEAGTVAVNAQIR